MKVFLESLREGFLSAFDLGFLVTLLILSSPLLALHCLELVNLSFTEVYLLSLLAKLALSVWEKD